MSEGVVNCSACGAPVPLSEFEEGGRARMSGSQRFCPLCAQTALASVLEPEEVETETMPRTRLPRYEGETDSDGLGRRVEWQHRKAEEAAPKYEKKKKAPLRMRRRKRR